MTFVQVDTVLLRRVHALIVIEHGTRLAASGWRDCESDRCVAGAGSGSLVVWTAVTFAWSG